jgi:hypothetical protein
MFSFFFFDPSNFHPQDLRMMYPPNRTNINQDELESAMALVIALEKLSKKFEEHSKTPGSALFFVANYFCLLFLEKVRVPIYEFFGNPIAQWQKNSQSLLQSWAARALGLENWKSLSAEVRLHIRH